MTTDHAERVRLYNQAVENATALLPWGTTHPIARVQWIHISRVQANDYNPNAVASEEMRLLHTSISEDGYTQPVVAIFDPETERYIIVDGFHRWMMMTMFSDISDTTGGYLPLVVLDKPLSDRMASTIRHNRARGKHSIAGMGNLVFQMLLEGETDETICRKIGVDAEELVRLKHITGYAKLFEGREYTQVTLTGGQLRAKADYARENPDEHVPTDF